MGEATSEERKTSEEKAKKVLEKYLGLKHIGKKALEDLIQSLTIEGEVDISSYKDCIQYNLCLGTNKRPGYRLYVLDDEYWIGALYGNRLWRCVAIQPIK